MHSICSYIRVNNTKMREIQHVGIWIRVSTEDQAKGESPEHHIARAKAYAAMKNWNVVTIYDLSGVSGKTVIDHPEARRMMQDVKKGAIHGLIFSKLARLARNTKELLDFADYFQDHHAALISLQEAIDTSSPAGRFFYSMIAAMAQWEREEIVDRVKASVAIRAKMGKSLGGQAPFGYSWDGKSLVIQKEEAVVRQLMFELFLKLKRKGAVAQELNARGHRTRSGKHFSDNTVHRLLTDPLAKGLRRSNYTTSTGTGKHWEHKDQKDWVFNSAPAIVSEEVWDSVNAIINKHRIEHARPAKRAVHLFAGIAVCFCGNKMYKPTNAEKYVCTKPGCRNKITVDDLETIFHEQLKSHVFDDSRLNEMHATIDSKEQALKNEIAVLEKNEKSLTRDIAQLFELHRNNQIPTEAFQSHHKPLYDQLTTLKESLPTLYATLDVLRSERTSADQILEDAKSLYTRWPTLQKDEKKSIIDSICKSIIVDTDSIEIHLTHVLPVSELTTNSRHNVMDSCSQPT